jgi:hypothetical protein
MKNLFRRGAFENQMTDEVQFHIHSRAADLIRSGMRPDEAARRARLESSGPEGGDAGGCGDRRGVDSRTPGRVG